MAEKLRFKKLDKMAVIPSKGIENDLAYDISCLMPTRRPITINAGSVVMLDTGLSVQLPPNYGAIIKERSSLAKQGLMVLGGVIDPDYRGEIKVIIANLAGQFVTLDVVSKLAQMILIPSVNFKPEEVIQLTRTKRGDKGFGSTGE